MISITEISTKNFHEFLKKKPEVAEKMNFAFTMPSNNFGQDAPFDFDSKVAYNAKVPDFNIDVTEDSFKLGNEATCKVDDVRTFLFEMGDDEGLIGIHLHGQFVGPKDKILNLDYIVQWEELRELIDGEVDNVYVQESGDERSE